MAKGTADLFIPHLWADETLKELRRSAVLWDMLFEPPKSRVFTMAELLAYDLPLGQQERA